MIRKSPLSLLRRFLSDTSGATAIEYGLIVGGISVAIIATVNSVGQQILEVFNDIDTSIGPAG
jgi:pilus assembly protein Flp/PilA